MTKVSLEKSGERYSLACHGHATGSETMCAAISTLVGTVQNYLRCTEFPFDEMVKDGDACVRWTGDGRANAAFEMLCAGFLALQATDQTKISVEIRIF